MTANDKSLTYFTQNIQFVVPYFQRRYVWNEDNWQQFWDELVSESTDCFLGTFILKRNSNVYVDDYGMLEHCLTVIDGQQRLTTLSILVKAMIQIMEEMGQNAEDFKRFIVFKKDHRSGFEVTYDDWCKLIQSGNDYDNYKQIIFDLTDSSETSLKDDGNVFETCMEFFLTKLKKASDETINRLIHNINDDQVKTIVIVELGENEDEQKIFDSVNSTGVPLTISEIIKNTLFESVRRVSNEGENIYKTVWKPIFESDDETIKKWTTMKGSGQNARSYIDSFFHCYAVIKGFFDPVEDKLAYLSRKYRKYANKHQTDSIPIIRDIAEYAKVYQKYFMNELDAFSYDDGVIRLLKILAEAKISTFDPYVLKILREEKDKTVIEQKFKMLENYVMRHYAIRTDHIKNFNADCKKMMSSDGFDFPKELGKDDISEEKLQEAFEKKIKQNARAKLILYWIELYRLHNDKLKDNSGTKYQYKPFELEHIMPQSWTDSWAPIIKDGRDVTENYVYQIGNMTLLSSPLNKKLGNGPFDEKVNGKEINGNHEKGIRQLSTLSITTEILDKNTWGEKEIADRTQNFAKEFNVIWPVK